MNTSFMKNRTSQKEMKTQRSGKPYILLYGAEQREAIVEQDAEARTMWGG